MRMLFGLFFSLSASAVTPAELRSHVIRNFPLIEEARLKREAADEEVRAARGDFDHKLKFKSQNRIEDKYENQYFETMIERNTGVQGITLIAGHRQGSGTFPAYDGKYDTSALGEIYAGLSLPLLRDRATDPSRTNLVLARLDREISREEIRMKEFMYVHKALSLYYKWIAEKRILEINRELLSLARDRGTMLEKKFHRGDIERVKLTDNERTLAKREAEVQKSEVKLRAIEAGLLLFLPETDSIAEISGVEIPGLKNPELGPFAHPENLPQIRILSLEKKKNKALEDLYDQSRLPGLSVNVLGARELSPNNPYDPDRAQLGLAFDLPLENRKARGKTVAQSYKIRGLEKRIEYTVREFERNYDAARSTIELSLRRFQTTTLEAEKTRKMAEAEQMRFRMGGSELFTVLLRELDVADVEIRKWTAWYDFHQAVLDAKLLNGSL